MRGVADYAVVYDIGCDRERTRVDRVLKGYGFRVQKSVFSCKLDRGARTRLIAALRALSIETGQVLVFRLQHASPVDSVGLPWVDRDAGCAFVI